jgi:hypothetical protein
LTIHGTCPPKNSPAGCKNILAAGSVGSPSLPSIKILFASLLMTPASAESPASLILILKVPMVDKLEWLELMVLELMVLILAVVAFNVSIVKLVTSRLSIL